MFRIEVLADDSGTWCSNALRFASEESAQRYAAELAWRWTAVREWRVVRTTVGALHPAVLDRN